MFEEFLTNFYFVPFMAFVAVLVLVPLGIKAAHHFSFVDTPDGDGGRKQHKEAVPPIGGVIMMPVFLAALFFSGFDMMEYWGVLAALTLVLVTGAIDDRVHVHAYAKLIVQVTASVLIIWPGGAVVYHLGDIFGFGVVELGWFAYLFSFAAVLLLINSMNLADGLDGLAGGQSFVILGWLFFVAQSDGQMMTAQMILVLLAVLAGFLIYNMRSPFRKRAVLFMGDAGSMSLGVMIAFFAVSLGMGEQPVDGGDPIFAPMSIAWVIALPVMDACAQFIRRMRQGRHPFDADRGHFHHLFVDAGVPVGRAVFVIIMLCVALGVFGASVMIGMPEFVLFFAWAAAFGGYTLISMKPSGFQSLLARMA